MEPLLAVLLLLTWLAVAFGCWLGFQIMRQNGRILERLDALEQRPEPQTVPAPAMEPAVPAGLPLGSDPPPFELPDLWGKKVSLDQFRGRRVLLVFFNPRCGYCLQMAPSLAALPWDKQGTGLVPLIVSTGENEENRKMVREAKLRCPVLLQEAMEVASRYEADGTPMGYLIDEQGKIASEIGVGSDMLMAFVERPAALPDEAWDDTPSGTHEERQRGNRPLSESRIERDGLEVGTPAPTFRQPGVRGGEIALQDFRGRKVLLVFSDPDCGPCDLLTPQLQQLHLDRPDLQVLMVSRGTVQENMPKVEEHGITFPVALQKKWEISRLYAMFGTPIGYLIDEQGVIASEAAVGAETVMALAHGTPPATNGHANGNGKGNGNANGKAKARHGGKEVMPLH